MAKQMFTCPFCNDATWRTRFMLWKHMSECMKKTQEKPVNNEVLIVPVAPIFVGQ